MTARVPYLRLLFWLKAKLMWRTYTRHTSSLLGVIFGLLFFAPVSLGIGLGGYFAFTRLAPPYAEHVLRAILLGAYFLWLLSPVIGYALTEDYDLGKLLLYPLTARQLLTGAILGSVLDFGLLLLVPVLLAALIAFGRGPLAFLLVALTLAAFLFHTVALSQGLGLAATGILRSRRARDLLIVLMPLAWMAIYVGTQVLSRRAAHYDWSHFLDGTFWRALSYLPPGLAARSVSAAGAGAYGVALGWLVAVMACAAGSLAFAGWLVQLVYTGEYTGSETRRRERTRHIARPVGERPALGLRLPPVVDAMVSKEIRYLRRDPAFKFFVMQLIYMLAVIAVGAIYPWQPHGQRGFGALSPPALWGWFSLLMVMEAHLVFNIFGVDAGAATVLFLFPASRREILIGKNVVLFAALSAANLALVAALTIVGRQPGQLVPLAVWAELAAVIFISAGNLISVWQPYPVVIRGWGMPRRSASRGLTYSLVQMLALLVTGVLALPVLLALLLPTFWVSNIWFAVTIPLAAIYAGFAYMLGLHFAEQYLLTREVEVVEKLRPAEGP